ncbi:CIH_HP2_G0023160.mRNA.1.CDS.1 [Saccharomyces cerevisiae]|nr:CIH_HP2_G0023160.mRNA.1.CDS.1 [Saccharomyces cerevisiae]CAI6473672.1 CIH_HP2_G0023160.mRNA.1.CDS.1 [Saccharomyces cerevisiae]
MDRIIRGKRDQILHCPLATQQQSRTYPLKNLCVRIHFVKRVGNVSGNTMVQGDLEVKDTDYYYAFILEPTLTSKNAKENSFLTPGYDKRR